MSQPSIEPQPLSAAVEYGIEFAREVLANHRVLVLTGAGISTDSGIPDYRGAGRTPRHPMTFEIFMGSFEAQQRYWARSFVGWNRIASAEPNPGHLALAEAERLGRIQEIITQNVDGLHQRAGSQKVIELHGRLDQVRCLACSHSLSRHEVDRQLKLLNPEVSQDLSIEFTPDGDAEIEATASFKIPSCERCGGVLKPDVVFFGESVPVDRVEKSMNALDSADALLVVGSSLAVNSGMRFARRAHKFGKPVVIVNIGQTKADSLASVKLEANASQVLERLLID